MTPYEPKVLHMKTRSVHFLSAGTPACFCEVVDIPGVTLSRGRGKDAVCPDAIAAAGQNGTQASMPQYPRGGDAAGC